MSNRPVYLHGMHDPGGETSFGANPSWLLFTEEVGRSMNTGGRDYRNWEEQGFAVIGRLNHGYGSAGTIPVPQYYQAFAQACATWVAKSPGCHYWIIGNEPNHEAERPEGIYISPTDYARCFAMARSAIKSVDASAQVAPAPVAPYHVAYVDGKVVTWTDYLRRMLAAIDAMGGFDWFGIHAYTRSPNPADLYSTAKMGAPLEHTYSGFLTYLDALDCKPASHRGGLNIITEFDENDGWTSGNHGVIQGAVKLIADYNVGAADPVSGVVAFRWQRQNNTEKWSIEDRPGVVDDFRQAAALGLVAPMGASSPPSSPEAPPAPTGSTLYIPTVMGGSTEQVPAIVREIDPRATARGVVIETPTMVTGQPAYLVQVIEWYNPDEADALGPDHHIMVDILDEAGQRMVGAQFIVAWPDGRTTRPIEAKPGEMYGGNFPMTPGSFNVWVDDGNVVSEIVRNIQMGAMTPSGWNPGEHTTTGVIFRRQPAAALPMPPAPTPIERLDPPPHDGSIERAILAHPVADGRFRAITQPYGRGVNRQYYQRFKVDGVPLEGHNGVDFATPTGASIIAVDSGTVVEAAYDPGGFGDYVKLRHAWGESLYAHLSRVDVGVGHPVQWGQQVGLSGATGNATGPHLHFGMRLYPYNRQDGMGGYSDPMPYLERIGNPARPVEMPAQGAISRDELIDLFQMAGLQYGLSWTLLAAQAWAESSFRLDPPNRLAMGIMQIAPATWREWAPRVGVDDPLNPAHSIAVGAAYLKWLIAQMPAKFPNAGPLYLALIAYGWGIGNLFAGKEEPPQIWRTYAAKIIFGRDLLDNLWRE